MIPSALADTGLLIAVPVNRAEYEERIPKSDWLGKFLTEEAKVENLRSSIDQRWRNVYAPLVAEPLEELAEMAGSRGAEVRTRATLDDLAALTRSKRIVILFAHWKGPEVLFDDLLPGWTFDSFENLAAQSSTRLGMLVASELQKRRSRRGSVGLLDVLNEVLDTPITIAPEGVISIQEHAVTRQARRRRELETLFPYLLRPGNRLELYDGLYAKEEVEESVAPDFSGVLDLTTCTSTVLADHLAARRRRSLRTVQFPMVVEFIWAAKAVCTALQFTANGDFEYLEARNVATCLLNRAIEELGEKDL